jgi:hypothetical protein
MLNSQVIRYNIPKRIANVTGTSNVTIPIIHQENSGDEILKRTFIIKIMKASIAATSMGRKRNVLRALLFIFQMVFIVKRKNGRLVL